MGENAPAQIPTFLNELHKKVEALQEAVRASADVRVDGRGGGGHDSGMNDRVSKLEGTMDGIKQSQSSLLAVVSIVGGVALAAVALIATLQVFTLTEIGGIEDTIREEFRALRAEASAQTSAIANSIAATKQQAPQVILLPAPQPTQPQQ